MSFFSKFKSTSDKKLVICLTSFTFLLFVTVSIVRHFSLCSGGYDLGIFDQAIWNVTQGNSLFCTIKYTQGGILLGDHFEPILFLIAPLYLLWPNVLVLLILQSFLLASALIPLYLIAKTILEERFLVFAFLICYIISKPLRGIAFFDFYPESFIIPLLWWAYYFLIKRKDALLWTSLGLLLLCKEDTTFLIVGIGLFAWFNQQRRGLGVLLIVLAVFLWWLETSVLIPYFAPKHQYEYLSNLPFGLTYADNLKFCMVHPFAFIKFIFTKAKINYVLRLLGPLGFLSFLSPSHCILFFIPLLKNLLATKDNNIFYTIDSHYIAGIVPFVFIASIYGCRRLLNGLNIKKKGLIAGTILIILSLLFSGRSDLCRLMGFWDNMKINHTLLKIKSLELIPPDASVVATNSLCPHLSHRKNLFLLDHLKDYLIFPQYIATDKIVIGKERVSLKENLWIDEYLRMAQSKGYKVIASVQNNDFVILASPGN